MGHDVPGPMMIASSANHGQNGIFPWRSHGFYRRGACSNLNKLSADKGYSTRARVGGPGPWGGKPDSPQPGLGLLSVLSGRDFRF